MKKLLIILTGSVLLTAGCKKGFLDINSNPNTATEVSITPDLLLPNAMNVTGGRLAASYAFLNRVFGQWAPTGSFSANSEEQTYNITSNFATGIWSGIYDNLTDYDFVEKQSKAAGLGFYEGIAKVMKAVCFQELVDCYGNVPYSKAFDVTGNIRPSYDGGQAIYNDLFVQLQNARTLITNADANAVKSGTDIMFNYDKTKWRRFINTLALRMLLRQTQVTGFNPAAEIAKINADGSGFITTDADVSPGFIATDGKLNPFWANFGYTTLNIIVNKFNYANPFVLNLMKNMNGGNGGPTSDIRYKYFFKKANIYIGVADQPSHWAGMNYGLPPATAFSYDKLSNIGGTANDIAEKLIGTAPVQGLCKTYDQRAWIITNVEAKFLMAEALARGWAINTPYASAQAAYNAAVTSSYAWLNVPNAATEAATYLASADTKVAWPATQAAQINVILLQKYIGLCGMAPLEIWSDWRRVPGFVTIPISVAPGTTSTTQFNRLLYPQAEYNVNTDNVQAQGTINPFTSKVFWDQ